MFWSTLARMIVVPIAFAIAALAAFAVLFTLGSERVVQAISGQTDVDGLGVIVDILSQGWLIVSSLTMIPALGLVIIGEVARIRSALYYILGGGAALAAVPLLARYGQGIGGAAPSAILWQVFATAGFAGGLIYWMIAGRRA